MAQIPITIGTRLVPNNPTLAQIPIAIGTRPVTLLLLAISMFSCSPVEDSTAPRPNIVIIMADDLGYGDVSLYNAESKISTPNIDKLGQNGIQFMDAHTTSSVCSPTRYGLLTGRYNWRSTLKSGVTWSYSPALIKENQTTLGSMLQKQGYKTGAVGKWHLGWDWDNIEKGSDSITFKSPIKNGPTTRGFDYFFGIKASLDIPPYVYVENDMPTAPPDRRTEDTGFRFWRDGLTGSDFDHEQVLPTLKDKAVSFIKENKEDPFFLYFPLPAPHTPILPTEEFLGQSGLSEYGDFVMMVDWVVAEIVKALEGVGVRENTLLVFTSDNGCAPVADISGMQEKGHYPSYVFRGHKADIFDGGHRVPFIVNWPEKLEGSRKTDALISTVDFMATFAEILGVELTEDEGPDSQSYASVLNGENYSRKSLVHHSIDGEFALRKGDWKLIMTPGSGGWSYPRKGANDSILATLPSRQLYNMANDPGEESNQIESETAIADEMQSELENIILKGRSTPGPDLKNDHVDKWPQIDWIAN